MLRCTKAGPETTERRQPENSGCRFFYYSRVAQPIAGQRRLGKYPLYPSVALRNTISSAARFLLESRLSLMVKEML